VEPSKEANDSGGVRRSAPNEKAPKGRKQAEHSSREKDPRGQARASLIFQNVGRLFKKTHPLAWSEKKGQPEVKEVTGTRGIRGQIVLQKEKKRVPIPVLDGKDADNGIKNVYLPVFAARSPETAKPKRA